MPIKIKSMETAPNGTVSVKLSFPDSELDKVCQRQWKGSRGSATTQANHNKAETSQELTYARSSASLKCDSLPNKPRRAHERQP